MLKFFFLLFFLLFSLLLTCQVIHNNYTLLKFGSGINYGGNGFNFEYRFKHVGISVCGGYKPVQSGFEYYIPASYNFGCEITYYYFFKRNEWQWFNSLYIGWLNNYYEPELYNKQYDPVVYGLAYITGICIRDEFVNLHVGTSIENGVLIYNKKSHPYYSNNWHIFLTAGLGFNIFSIYQEIKWNYKHKKNSIKKVSTIKLSEHNKDSITTAINEKIQQTKPLSIIDSCKNSAFQYVYISNDTLFFLKKISPYQFVYGKVLYNENYFHYYQATSIDSTISNVQIFIGEGRLNDITNEDLPELQYDVNMTRAKNGLILLYIYEGQMYIIIENLLFSGKNKRSYINRIEICKEKISKN